MCLTLVTTLALPPPTSPLSPLDLQGMERRFGLGSLALRPPGEVTGFWASVPHGNGAPGAVWSPRDRRVEWVER